VVERAAPSSSHEVSAISALPPPVATARGVSVMVCAQTLTPTSSSTGRVSAPAVRTQVGFSPGSRTPSPQRAGWQSLRQAPGRMSSFSAPSSQVSPVSMWPSPQ
jgi:hypothetical protein